MQTAASDLDGGLSPEPRLTREGVGGLAVSLCFHLALLILFGAVKWGIIPNADLDTIAGGFSEADWDSMVTLPQVADEQTEPAGGQATVTEVVESTTEALPVDTVIEAPAGDAETSAPEVAAVAEQTSSGGGQGDQLGDGAGEGGSFFDVDSAGQRLVYVVDCSKSMNRPYPSPERTRFGRVKRELVSSIQSLDPEQRFFVIYFNTEAHPMPGTRLVPRESYDVPHYLRWLSQFPTDGRTNPEPALLLALGLKPDAIFFLTDGAFRPNIVDNVVKANLRRTPVHAIGFGDDVRNADSEGVAVLEDLANRTGGRLTLISDEGRVIRR